jgi:hypothetical protein
MFIILNNGRDKETHNNVQHVFYVCRVMTTQQFVQDWKDHKSRTMNLLLNQADRKITRNQKQKHCEIYPVQKASIST